MNEICALNAPWGSKAGKKFGFAGYRSPGFSGFPSLRDCVIANFCKGVGARTWLLVSLCCFGFGVVGCGGGGNSTTNTQPAPTLNLIAITPPSPSVTVGQTQQFKAMATFSDNSTKDVTGLATCRSSDTTIATITSSGLATSLKVGSVTITGTLQTVNGSTSLGVSASPPPQVSVSILPTSVNVAAGGSQQFSASVTGSPNTAVSWEVSGIAGGNASVGTVSATGLYTAPMSAGKIVVSAVAQANQSDSGMSNVSILAPHRFGVRPTSTIAEFFDRISGSSFVPRGNNYIRLATLTDANGNPILAHTTFNVDLYDSERVEIALTSMQASGYNIVTVTLQTCCQGTIGDPAGGLSKPYILNIVDFLERAKAHDIAVVFANSGLPAFGGFNEILAPCNSEFGDINLTNLSSCGVNAYGMFFQEFAQALINAGAPMDAIFAYEVWDEYYYSADAAPLNATNGTITAANGQTYDMGSPTSKQQMMDDGLVYFADQVQEKILAVDPTALVTMSFFPPEGPNPSRIGDQRIIAVYPAIANSTLNYVDLHAYPVVFDLTMDQTAQNFGFVGYQQQKPVVMGEFGAFTSVYSTPADAASALQNWQIQSCTYNFKGWMLWTWDTDEQPELWNALSQGAAINQTLSPMSRPNPCVGP